MAFALNLVDNKHSLSILIGSLTKAHPRNSAATACIAKVNFIVLVPRFNSRYRQRDLTITLKAFRGEILAKVIDRSINGEAQQDAGRLGIIYSNSIVATPESYLKVIAILINQIDPRGVVCFAYSSR